MAAIASSAAVYLSVRTYFTSCNCRPTRRSRTATLFLQEHRDMANEKFGILVLRPVRGVRVEDQLCVGEILLKNVRVDRIDDDVVTAVDDERRLPDSFQIFVGPCA